MYVKRLLFGIGLLAALAESAVNIDCDLKTDACAATGMPLDQWRVIAPDDSNLNTYCAQGRFSFRYMRGASNKLVLFFQGGGGAIDDNLWTVSPPYLNTNYNPSAILSRTLPGSPFTDWHMVFISYCTGDVHAGENEQPLSYKDQVTQQTTSIRHLGGRNVRSVLSWVTANFPTVAELTLMGCSAGSIGATVWADQILDAYPSARRTVILDAYIDALGSSSRIPGLLRTQWAGCNLFTNPVSRNLCLTSNAPGASELLLYIRRRIVAERPDVRVALVTGLMDLEQTTFFAAMKDPVPAGACECQPALNAAANYLLSKDGTSLAAQYLKGLANWIANVPTNYCVGLCNGLAKEGVVPPASSGLYHRNDVVEWTSTVLLPAITSILDQSSFGFMLYGGTAATKHCITNDTTALTTANYGTTPTSVVNYISAVLRDGFPARIWPQNNMGFTLPGYMPGLNYVINNFNPKCSPQQNPGYTARSGSWQVNSGGTTVVFNNFS